MPAQQLLDVRTVHKQQAVTKLFFFRKKFLIKLLLLVIYTVVLSLFYIWSRVQIVQIGYELNERTSELQATLEENKRLKMELSLMRSPDRVGGFAMEKLNMISPGQDKLIEIKPHTHERE